MFADREDAGKKLGLALKKYRNKGVIVLAIPRGGAEVAYHAAKYLNAELSMIVSRKLPNPYNAEAGFGAVAEDGSLVVLDFAKEIFSQETIRRIMEEQKAETARRVKMFREGRPLPVLKGKTVIIVDDGIAMGATMRAAIMMCRKAHAGWIVAAAPVAGMAAAEAVEADADELSVVEIPGDFHAVADYYDDWYDVSDEGALEIINKWEDEKTVKK